MFLLATLLALFAATVLTGHRRQFFIGAVASGLIAVFVLHAINPDALIVRTNVAPSAASPPPAPTPAGSGSPPACRARSALAAAARTGPPGTTRETWRI